MLVKELDYNGCILADIGPDVKDDDRRGNIWQRGFHVVEGVNFAAGFWIGAFAETQSSESDVVKHLEEGLGAGFREERRH